ncbi:Uncharacterised protein [Klebsiella pneumoniae]|nr:Uncharacterised protein [Klebsiella pneumoniae]
MPLTDIIEANIIVSSSFKKNTEPTNSILNTSYKGSKRTTAMYSYLPDDESICPDMFTHKNPADFALTSILECSHH